MRYKLELIGSGKFITNDKHRIRHTLDAYLDNDEDVQILICVGNHKPDDLVKNDNIVNIDAAREKKIKEESGRAVLQALEHAESLDW